MSGDFSEPQKERIKKLTSLYYSRKDIQKAIFEFSKNREIAPRYFEGFGKRPDSFQYPGDIFESAKKGATSFHCSEELWSDPLQIQTGMNEKQTSELRIGWDLLMDIDSKYIDYSKIMAELIIKFMKFHGVQNVGIKFSGSKGFHLIVPWKAFPKEVNGENLTQKFPEYPRIITKYIMENIKHELIEKISDFHRPNKYIKDLEAPKEVMPDLVLVSPRHLFRVPYSLHEKTALASVVLTEAELKKFNMKDADPMKIEVRNYLPDSIEGEASELLMQALDWSKSNEASSESVKTERTFNPIKIKNMSEKNFPPCIRGILKGINDGKKRGLFALLNFFRSIGMEKEEVEKRLYEWNKKNPSQLKEGYIKSQIDWSYSRKPMLPPNCREFYQGIAVCVPENLCDKIKNPVNYTTRKDFAQNKNSKGEK